MAFNCLSYSENETGLSGLILIFLFEAYIDLSLLLRGHICIIIQLIYYKLSLTVNLGNDRNDIHGNSGEF